MNLLSECGEPKHGYICAVHPIGFELGKPSDMQLAVRISLILCAVIYSAIGVCGYLLFGDSTMADILINFDWTSASPSMALLNDTVRLSYALHLMLVFPLLNFSLRNSIDEILFPKKPPLSTDTARFVSLTLIVLVVSYLAAIAFPNIWYFFQFTGSTSAVCLAFIFPGAIVLRYLLHHLFLLIKLADIISTGNYFDSNLITFHLIRNVQGISNLKDRVMAGIMIILAVITSAIAISTNIYGLLGNNS